MRLVDLLAEAWTSLFRRRLRTLLAMLGVAAGCYILVVSLALGQGVQDAISKQLRRQDRLRRILAWPGGVKKVEAPIVVEGDMPEVRRERLREAIKLRREQVYVPTGRGITSETEAALAALPGVLEVRPALVLQGRVSVGKTTVTGMIYVASATDQALRRRIVAGDDLRGGAEAVLVSEYVAYRAGIADEVLLGQEVKVELEAPVPGFQALLQIMSITRPDLDAKQQAALNRVMARLPEVLLKLDLPADDAKVLHDLLGGAKTRPAEARAITLPVRGVFRDVDRTELSPWDAGLRPVDVYLPPEAARRLYLAMPGRTNRDLPQVSVLVAEEADVKPVQERIKEMGLETFSLSELLDQVRFNLRIIVVVLTLLACMALGVAVLGIANTMTMAILQRTHEIGVLKALGATDRQVLILFLSEGVVIGAVGGLVGMLAGWLTAWPGDAFARWLLEAQTPMRLEESVFAYPWWLLLGTPLLAMLLTTLAAWWPARRAARIDPVAALRER
jgi:putative ABC transport system permease protein